MQSNAMNFELLITIKRSDGMTFMSPILSFDGKASRRAVERASNDHLAQVWERALTTPEIEEK